MAHAWYGVYLSLTGRFDEAFVELKRAKSLDPLSRIMRSVEGSTLFLARRYDQAIEQFRETLEIDGDFAIALSVLGATYESKGEYQKALTAYQRALSVQGDLPQLFAFLARTHALDGRPEKALDMIGDLKSWPDQLLVHDYSIALIYAALGDIDEAFRRLDLAYSNRNEDLVIVKVDPRLDVLRADPRYAQLLEQVGFADAKPLKSK